MKIKFYSPQSIGPSSNVYSIREKLYSMIFHAWKICAIFIKHIQTQFINASQRFLLLLNKHIIQFRCLLLWKWWPLFLFNRLKMFSIHFHFQFEMVSIEFITQLFCMVVCSHISFREVPQCKLFRKMIPGKPNWNVEIS